MNTFRSIVLFFLFCVVLTFAGFSQDIQKSTKTETISGREYYLHTVLAGQTLYSIAKAYNVSRDEIIEINPSSKNGLKINQVLKIPVISNVTTEEYFRYTIKKHETLEQIAKKYTVKTEDIFRLNPGLTSNIRAGLVLKIPKHKKKADIPTDESFVTHTVEKGETLFSIAKQYNMTVDDLKKNNPGITETIRIGQQINVPVTKNTQAIIDNAKDTTNYDCGNSGLKKNYDVGLLVPLYLDWAWEIDTSNVDRSAKKYRSLTFIGFYEGFLIALDSLEKSGLSVKIKVDDVGEDTTNLPDLLKKSFYSNLDLLIGPFYHDNFKIAARWAKQKHVKLVNSFSSRIDLIQDNPFVFKNVASCSRQAQQTVEYIKKTWPGCNIFFVHSENEDDKEMIEAYRTALTGVDSTKKNFFESIYPRDGVHGISLNMSTDKTNVIISMVNGEVSVSNYIRGISELSLIYPLVVFGQKSWEDYSSLEIEYLMNIRLHILSNSYIDYNRSAVKDFIIKYRDRFKTEPDAYAFAGYDNAMYFLNALRIYGKDFQKCLKNYHPDLLQTNFDFEQQGEGGWENRDVCIYRYENYKLINAITNPQKTVEINKKPY